jgi:uncharacterized protein YjbI with pentapeptide repeats
VKKISQKELNLKIKLHLRWLGNNYGIRLDLSGYDLRFLNLSYANLSHADLSYADLRFADLTSANLSHAILGDGD